MSRAPRLFLQLALTTLVGFLLATEIYVAAAAAEGYGLHRAAAFQTTNNSGRRTTRRRRRRQPRQATEVPKTAPIVPPGAATVTGVAGSAVEVEASETPPPVQPTPMPRRNAPISGGVLNGKAISLPQPVYPPVAKAARQEGTVTVQVTLDEEGRVISARAVAGPPLLQNAAVQAAYRARFSPTKLSGQPVKVTGVVTYNFRLPEERRTSGNP